MVKLGKITFRELLDSDLNKLQIFCDECKSLGYNNNASFNSIKLDKMQMPYGKYFIGIDDSVEATAKAMVIPALGPSFGVAPSGT